MTAQTKANLHGIMSTFTYFYANSMTLDKLIEHIKEDRDYKNIDLDDILFDKNGFYKDIEGYSIIEQITLNKDTENLFQEILNQYKEKFKNIEAKEWNFISLQPKNECHEILIKFYGHDYFESIFDLNNDNISLYSRDYFAKYYFSNQLNHKIIIENLKNFHEHNCNLLHTLVFLDKDKEAFKKFILNSEKSEETQKSSNGLLFSSLLYKTHQQVYSFSYGSSETFIELKLNLPKESDLTILIDNWGINRTSKIISDYLKLQEEYITVNKIPFTKISIDRNKLMKLIDSNIDFIDCGKTLALGLTFEPELLSYFLITDVIKKEQLLTHVKNDSLQIRINHHILQNTLDTNDNPKRKIKI